MKIVGGVLHCLCHAVQKVCDDDKVDETITELRLKRRRVVAIYADGKWIEGEDHNSPSERLKWEAYFEKKLKEKQT